MAGPIVSFSRGYVECLASGYRGSADRYTGEPRRLATSTRSRVPFRIALAVFAALAVGVWLRLQPAREEPQLVGPEEFQDPERVAAEGDLLVPSEAREEARDPVAVAEEDARVLRLRFIDFSNDRPLSRAFFHARGDDVLHATDRQGFINYRGAGEGRLEFEATAPGYCVVRGSFDAGAGPEVDIPLVAASAVEGQVLDVLGQPIPRATLRLYSPAPTRQATPPPTGYPPDWLLFPEREEENVGADEEGRFRMAGLPPNSATHYLRAWRPGYIAKEQSVQARGIGLTTHVEFRLAEEPTGALAGKVTLNGQPITAAIRVIGQRGDSWVDSDDGGAYRVTKIAPGMATVEVQPIRWQQVPDDLEGRRAEVEITVDRETWLDIAMTIEMKSIEGRVTDTNEVPLPDLFVRATAPPLSLWDETDEDGRYSIDAPVSIEPYEVALDTVAGRFVHREVRPGSRGVDFDLPELVELHIRARDADTGAELTGFFVHIRRVGEEDWDGGQYAHKKVDHGVRVYALPEPIDVRVRRRRFAPVEVYNVQLAPGRSMQLDVELKPAAVSR